MRLAFFGAAGPRQSTLCCRCPRGRSHRQVLRRGSRSRRGRASRLDQEASNAVHGFFTVGRDTDWSEDSANFVAALCTPQVLKEGSDSCPTEIGERIEMLEDAREIFASHEKKGSWAAKAMNHPHAKTYIANLVVDLTKSQLTQKLSAPLVEKGQRLARALEACDPDILSCHPESSKTVIDAVGDLCSSFSEARASCYIVYLPSVQALDMNQVVTALQAALKRAIEPLSKCDITVESVVEVASLPGSSSRSSRSSALMGQLKATPGIDSSSAEWKTCCWMIKVSAGPLGRRRRR